MSYREIKNRAWISDGELAVFFCVSMQTVKRWFKNDSAPLPVLRTLSVLGGDFPVLAKDRWHGWRFNSGRLWSPESDYFLPSDLMASTRHHHLVNALEFKIKELESSISAFGLSEGKSIVVQFPIVTFKFSEFVSDEELRPSIRKALIDS